MCATTFGWREMEWDCGIVDGFAEVLEDSPNGAEFETFGPVGLRE